MLQYRPMDKDYSQRDAEVFAYLWTSSLSKEGIPTRRKIVKDLNFSSTDFLQHSLVRLRDNGFVNWEAGKAKTLMINPSVLERIEKTLIKYYLDNGQIWTEHNKNLDSSPERK